MEIIKLLDLKHSGIGKDAIHKKVFDAFKSSEEQGISYCKQIGLCVDITETHLNVEGIGMYAFRMSALIRRLN